LIAAIIGPGYLLGKIFGFWKDEEISSYEGEDWDCEGP